MKWRARFHASFRRDLRAQLAWLARNADVQWIEGLRTGLSEATHLLERHPRAGVLEESAEESELRRLILRRVPYVLWYSVGTAQAREAWVLRLFYARQRRAAPSWPPRRPEVPRGHKSRPR